MVTDSASHAADEHEEVALARRAATSTIYSKHFSHNSTESKLVRARRSGTSMPCHVMSCLVLSRFVSLVLYCQPINRSIDRSIMLQHTLNYKDTLQALFTTLERALGNILFEPSKDKFRVLRSQNAVIKSKVLDVRGEEKRRDITSYTPPQLATHRSQPSLAMLFSLFSCRTQVD